APPPAVASAPAPGAPAATLVSTPPANEGDSPVYTKWWFWTAVGVVVVGGVVTAVALSSGGSSSWSNLPDVKGQVR
ncbi:MAG TPA: hypothetical protein VHJ20_24465, partial [Polyangia bacterium]|nr:hypothetical protein [Polyangia bacterium]